MDLQTEHLVFVQQQRQACLSLTTLGPALGYNSHRYRGL